jgi:hypothetical protein
MWNMIVPSFILNLLTRTKSVEKMGGTICDDCRLVIGEGHGEYYRINSKEFCSLNCYYENVRVNAIIPKAGGKIVKKKKKK